MVQSRKLFLSLIGVVAWSSVASETVLTILEAASLPAATQSIIHLTAVSIALEVLSLFCIAFYIYQELRQRGGSQSRSAPARALVFLAIALSTIALIVSLVSIILIKSQWSKVTQSPTKSPISDWNSQLAAQIALWTLSCVTQIMLYTSPFWHGHTLKVQAVTVSGPRDSVMSEIHNSQPGADLYVMEPAHPLSPLAAALPSPTFSSRSSHSLQSFRDSLRHAVRPANSRTTLISRPSFTRNPSIYSQSESVDNVSQSDGFDSWDTSSVSLQARDAVLQTAPSKGTVLDPIPGSRPTTPARALEGPFLTELPEEREELTPPKMRPDVSRPPSPIVSEAHIHPLFRTESPIPPPEATPGTSILASPLANQAIACTPRSFNRMRSNSQLKNAHSVRDRPTSPQSVSESLGPPSRELTPPIPDFVLNSSPRSSFSGSRRVQLQYSPDR